MSAELPDGCESNTVDMPFFPGTIGGVMDQILKREEDFPPVARINWLALRSAGRVFALEDVAVDLDVVLQIPGHILLWKDRCHRTLGLTGTAVDALVRMDVELVGTFVNAIHR